MLLLPVAGDFHLLDATLDVVVLKKVGDKESGLARLSTVKFSLLLLLRSLAVMEINFSHCLSKLNNSGSPFKYLRAWVINCFNSLCCLENKGR